MATHIVTRANKGGRLSIAEMDANFSNLKATADAAAPQATTYTKTETDTRIQAVVGAAPAALDTLQEIATQLATDENAVAALTNTVATKAPLTHVSDYSLHLTSTQNTWLDSITVTYTEVNYLSGVTSAIQTQLGNKENTSNKGIANGYASLTASGLVPTIQLGSGTASSSTFLRGDGSWQAVSVPWITKTTAYTAVAKDRILANTTSSAFTITLPASPSVGDEIYIVDAGCNFAVNKLTVARNGQNIIGQAQDLELDQNNQGVMLIYSGATKGWVML